MVSYSQILFLTTQVLMFSDLVWTQSYRCNPDPDSDSDSISASDYYYDTMGVQGCDNLESACESLYTCCRQIYASYFDFNHYCCCCDSPCDDPYAVCDPPTYKPYSRNSTSKAAAFLEDLVTSKTSSNNNTTRESREMNLV